MSAAIYLDCAATTPVDARVARAMHDCLVSDTQFGNAASAHVYGREASRCIDPLEDTLERAATDPSPDSLEELRRTVDRMMRALAGILIELGQQP